MIEAKTLILNADWTVLKIIDWQRAFILLYKGVVTSVDFYDHKISDSKNRQYSIPAIVACKKYIHIQNRIATLSNRNLFTRDNNTCQYCGGIFNREKLTIDHLIPKSRWNKKDKIAHSWENVVTACRSCNTKKADKLCSECQMFPRKHPHIPTITELILKQVNYKIPKEWQNYIKNYEQKKKK